MYSPGHVGMALLLYSIVGYAMLNRQYDRHALAGGVIVVLVTMLPDWDGSVGWLAHRGLTHTVWFALIVGLVVGLVVVSAGRSRQFDTDLVVVHGWWAGSLSSFSIGVHLLADSINPMGISPFAPFWDVHISFNLVPASDPLANAALFAIGVTTASLVWQTNDPFARNPGLERRLERYLDSDVLLSGLRQHVLGRGGVEHRRSNALDDDDLVAPLSSVRPVEDRGER